MTSLSEYLRSNGLSQREFAARVGLSKTYVNEIVAGSKTPSLKAALEIQEATKGAVTLASLLKSNSAKVAS
ncbi:helix-turn-helix transcriptional regulator [Alloyangia pacifica]|uniref:helix-turn-helix transcriptional regulator n=1 Tax=Alloyangia pacifica TaxID=311180 RepID=UPI000B8310EA